MEYQCPIRYECLIKYQSPKVIIPLFPQANLNHQPTSQVQDFKLAKFHTILFLTHHDAIYPNDPFVRTQASFQTNSLFNCYEYSLSKMWKKYIFIFLILHRRLLSRISSYLIYLYLYSRILRLLVYELSFKLRFVYIYTPDVYAYA